MKIMPESPDVDLEALKSAIKEAMPADAEFHKIDEETELRADCLDSDKK